MTQAPDDFSIRYEAGATRLLDRIEGACIATEDWTHGVRGAVITSLALLSVEPELGTLLLFEPYMSGRQAQLRHEETLAQLAELLRRGRDEAGAGEVPELVEEALVGSATFLVARSLRADEPDLLPALAPELTALLLTPYLGREEAERIASGG